MAIDYWLLRAASEKEDVAVHVTSTAWRVSKPSVAKASKQYRQFAQQYIGQLPEPVDVKAPCETICRLWSTQEQHITAEDVHRMCEDEDVLRSLSAASKHRENLELRKALEVLELDKRFRARIFAVQLELETMRKLFHEIRASDT